MQEMITYHRERGYTPKARKAIGLSHKNIHRDTGTYKLLNETNKGVRRVIRCIGITGYGDMQVST